ncbi:MAG: histidine kinase [Niastella sp.]|nr:histidine kinase [Niastella sp.]
MKWLVASVFCLIVNAVVGQQLHFDTYTTSNGLVANEIRCITQAANGFMYFGTPAGVTAYDGNRFRKYNYHSGFLHSLVQDIEEVAPGDIAFFATAARTSYHIRNQRLSTDTLIGGQPVRSLYKARDGSFFACTEDGLYRYERDKLTRIPVYEGQEDKPELNCMTEWLDSFVVIGRSFLSIDVFNKYTWQLVSSSVAPYFVRNLFADSHGKVWIGCIEKGVLCIDRNSVEVSRLQFVSLPAFFEAYSTTEFRSTVEDKQGNLWLGTVGKGLIRYHPASGRFQQISSANGLVGNTVFVLYADREDNLWIGSNNGLQKLVYKDWLLYSSRDGLPADLVLDVIEPDGGGFVTAGYSGLAWIRPQQKTVTWNTPFEDKTVNCLIKKGNTCYALSSHTLNVLSFDRDMIRLIRSYPLRGNYRTMIAYKDNLLLGGDNVLAVLHDDRVQENSLASGPINCMTVDRNGILWTGSKDNTVCGYQMTELLQPQLLYTAGHGIDGVADEVHSILADKQGRIWYSTVLHGLYMLKPDGGEFLEGLHLSIQGGMSDNTCRGLLLYNDTTLLAGTGAGLDRVIISLSSNRYSVVPVSTYYDFSSTVYTIKPGKGRSLLLGTESGLMQLPGIATDKQDARRLPVYFTSFSLLNNADSVIDVNRPVHLSYDQSSFTIDFASPGFVNERALRYMYRLQGGRQSSWSEPTSSGSVTFSNLPPGKFLLEVKAMDINNRLSTATAALSINVATPFWQRAWFLLLVLLSVGLIVYLLIRRRVANIRRQAALKQKVAETEMMALRAQMNPHFIFNCISSIDNFIQDNDRENASGWLNKFARLIRNILDSSKTDSIPFWKDWETLRLYIELEQLRSDGQYSVELEADDALLNGHYRIPPLIAQPYIENAIHHGLKHRRDREGKLHIEALLLDGVLEYRITDNGIGRTASAALNGVNKLRHNSYGMQMSRERIALFNEQGGQDAVITDLYDEAGAASGTMVRVILFV